MREFKFSIGGKLYYVEIEDPSSSVLVVKVNGQGYTVCREDVASAAQAEVVPEPVAEEEIRALEEVRAPIPGKIVAVAVDPGDRVRHGDALCTLEAMKMESVINAPINGTVEEVRVKAGDEVQYNDVLVLIAKLTG